MSTQTCENDTTLYVLDSYALIYRSYFAFISRPLVNKDGRNISAVFGFFRTLHALLERYKPHFFVAAFDSRTKTFRHDMYPEYKATRQKTPEDLHAQVPVIEEILGALGIPVLRQDGYEADDIIATLSARCCQENRCCRIISSDKDLMQLVRTCPQKNGSRVELMRTNKNSGWDILSADDVTAEWGVPPELMLDILSLTGDAADNVPGVKGIGDKTAIKLLIEHGSLDGIYRNIDSITGTVGKKLADGKESAYFSRELIKLRYDADIAAALEDFCIDSLDTEAAGRLLLREGAVSVARQFCDVSHLTVNTADTVPQDSVLQSVSAGSVERGAALLDESDDIPVSLYKENPGIYTAITDECVLHTLIDACIQKKYVAFDCETTSVNTLTAVPVGFSLSHESGTAYYIPLRLSNLADSGVSTVSKETAIRELSRLFAAQGLTVVMHNAKFDYTVMTRWGVVIDTTCGCTLFDTMIAAWLLSPERKSFSLESLTGARLGLKTTAYTDIVAKDETFDFVQLSIACHYAAEDADITLQLAHIFEPLLQKAGLMPLFSNLEMPLIPLLSHMEQRGIMIQTDELVTYTGELQQELSLIEKQIYDMTGHPFNIASPKQLQTVLFEELKLPTGKKTKTGYSTDGSVLEELALIHPVPAAIVRYRQLAKLKSTYVDTLPRQTDNDSRIHTSFIQTGTATGRLSSRDPNLQNIPVRDEEGRRIRMAFCAKPGCKLISADYSQIELVVLAHLSGDANMQHAFLAGEDIHRSTASLIFNVPSPEVTPEMRRAAKTINFGVMYGMSAFRLSNQLKISRTDAQDFISAYFAKYSGIRSYMDSIISGAESNGYVETIMGRRRYIADINSSNKTVKSGAERIAVNTPIQGSAADIVKKAMIHVEKSLRNNKLSAELLLQVHDELIIEAPEDEVERVCSIVAQEMETVVPLSVPLRVSVETGTRWGDFH